jgi:hypothetical protein
MQAELSLMLKRTIPPQRSFWLLFGVENNTDYMFGRKFTIVTDNKPLTWVLSVKDPSSRLLRWRLKLEEYDYHIVYKPGIRNTNADALSRINAAEINPVAETGSVLTEKDKMKILQEFHEQPIGGHLGMNRTFDRLKQYISWPGMKKEIENCKAM